MKIYKLMTLLGTSLNRRTTAKENETRNLEKFNKVNLEGRIELHLEKSSYHSIEIRTKKASDIANLVTDVRNGELYIHNEKNVGHSKTPKYIIRLSHSGISDIALSGVVRLMSNDVISQKYFNIGGEGILNGSLKVSVDNLNTDMNGVSNIKISGYADVADLNITGIGRINAKGLETNNAKKSTDGIATVLLPSN